MLAVASASAAPDKKSPPPPMDAREAVAKPAVNSEKRRTVGILEVRVDGVPDDVRIRFERGLEQQLDTAHYWLSTRAQMRERMKFSTKWTEGCFIGTCLGEVRTQTNAELVLLAALSGSGTSFGFVITVLRTDTGKMIAQEASRCDVCTVSEAMTEATLATIKLLNAVPDKLPDEGGDQGAAVDMAVGVVKKELATSKHHTSRVGLAMTLVGLAVAGAGTAAYFLADKPTYSYAVIGGGGGLALGGVAVLTF